MERDNRIFDIIEREHQRQKHGIKPSSLPSTA